MSALFTTALNAASPPVKKAAIRPRPSHKILPASVKLPVPGDPLPGLTDEQRLAFSDGLEKFKGREVNASGLGPIFNNSSCLACHSRGGVGGGGTSVATRFGKTTETGFDPLTSLGGSLLQLRSIAPAARELIPLEADVIARRQTPPLFGLGLVEAIPDATILAGVFDGKPDGVRGRAAIVKDLVTGADRVGRFGWKAQHATLLAFSADAYLNEMGITSRVLPVENAPNGKSNLLITYDTTLDPEDTTDPATGKADIDVSADFMRLLAPPPPRPLTTTAAAGRALFETIGCTVCHTPRLQTGASDISALNQKPVDLYSDLLLHDMGSLGDGIAQGDAGTHEFRTPPLWGVRLSATYLHDGRAPNLDTAIRMHEGEAAAARDRYNALAAQKRLQLTSFLNSL